MPKILLAFALLASQYFGTVLACSCPLSSSPQEEAAKSVNRFARTVTAIETISPPRPGQASVLEVFFNDIRSLLTGKTIRR
ncbi:MAG: hypothetical protein ABIO61_01380 [Thermomonas sp.]